MIISEFRLLEGLLAFRANLKSIKWGYPKFEYLPENEEEAQKARLPSISYERRIQEGEAQISGKDLARLIISKDRYSSLTVYLSFYREGVNEYRNYRYCTPFTISTYILEGLYTRGNTNTIQVKRDFKNSTDMVANVEALISHYSKETPENQTKLLQTLKHRGMRFDVDGIIGLVVNSRGDLHHFQNNLNRIQPTTFDQDDFETIAWVSFALTELAIKRRIADLNSQSRN